MEQTAYKTGTGNGRVLEQGLWLERYNAPGLPAVYGTGELFGDDMYTMEKLDPVPIEYIDTRTLLSSIVDVLERDVWPNDARISELDMDAHLARLAPLEKYMSEDQDSLLDSLLKSLDQSELEKHLTHGDPIMDNVMLRDGSIVLIDPIPSTPAIPDWRAVDVGRLLQSAVGYEHVRYDLHGPSAVDLRDITSMFCPNEEERAASLYWAAVHVLRSMAYVDETTVRALQKCCLYPITEEIRWTL
jgi:hypothetical protein